MCDLTLQQHLSLSDVNIVFEAEEFGMSCACCAFSVPFTVFSVQVLL